MKRTLAIMVGAAFILLLATLTLVIMPYLQISAEQVPPDIGFTLKDRHEAGAARRRAAAQHRLAADVPLQH
jgi:hypothetical protein